MIQSFTYWPSVLLIAFPIWHTRFVEFAWYYTLFQEKLDKPSYHLPNMLHINDSSWSILCFPVGYWLGSQPLIQYSGVWGEGVDF